MTQQKERILWIDAVKGIAIILVIASHLFGIGSPIFWYLCYGYMPVFFFMSGLTNRPSDKFRNNIAQKAKRLLIPYVIYGIALIYISNLVKEDFQPTRAILGLLYGRYQVYPQDIENKILMLGYRNCAIAPLWFLLNLFLGYVILNVYDCLKHNRWTVILISIIISFLSIYKTILLPWSIDTCFMTFLFLLVARKSGRFLMSDNKYTEHLLSGGVLMFVYFIFCKVNGPTNYSIGEYGWWKPYSVLLFFIIGLLEPITLSVLCKSFNSSIIIRIFSYIGKNSLRLMCIHLIIRDVILSLWPALHDLDYIYPPLILSVIFLANHLLGILTNRYSSRIKTLHYL